MKEELKIFRIIYKGVINIVWATNEMEARKILKEQYDNC